MSPLKRLAVGAALPLLLLPMACSKTDDATPPAAGGGGTTAKPAGGGGGSSTTGGAAAKVGGEVTIEKKVFTPKTVAVKVGESVKWTNKDTVKHQPVEGEPSKDVAGGFDISIAGGATGQTGPLTAGTHKYYCEIHNEMLGEITVS